MAEGRRGTRSRATDHSAGNVAGIGGVDLGTRSGQTQSGEGDDSQQSQVDHAGGEPNDQTSDPGAQNDGAQNGAQTGDQNGDQSNQGGGDQNGSQDSASHQTNSYGHTPEEAAEWDKLTKGKAHADRKITEQGQSLSDKDKQIETLTQENAAYGEKIGKIEGMLTQMMAQSAGNRGTDATASYGGDPNFDESGNFDDSNTSAGGNTAGQQGGNALVDRIDQLDNILGRVFLDQRKHSDKFDKFDQFQSDQQHEKDLAYIERELGCTREAAETMMGAHAEGDIVKLARTFELSTLPAQAREMAREQRERQRSATFHPATSGAPHAPHMVDETSLQNEAERIMGLNDGRPKQHALEKFMSDNPGVGHGIIAALTGFNV
jgi:hypothetical protein